LNDGSGGYYQYATQSNYDDEPVEIAAYGNGDGYFASPSLYDAWNLSCPTIATTTTTTTTTAEPTTTTTTTTTTAAPVLDKCHNKQFSAIQIRRDTDANFANYNPILASGEPAYAIDTRIFKIGDGVTDWNNLISPSQAPLGDLSTLSIINDPCDTEYILIQNAGRLTQVISINNIIKAISTIDGGNVIYTGC
jgi:hypothetical protein